MMIGSMASVSDERTAFQSLTGLELAALVGAMVFNLFTYWWANMAALPGLRLSRAAVLTQTTTSVANTLPGAGFATCLADSMPGLTPALEVNAARCRGRLRRAARP